MTLRIVVARGAEADLRRLIGFLDGLSPAAAIRAAETLQEAVLLLAEFPGVGRAVGGGRRQWPVRFGRDGFVILYREGETEVVIARVFHGRPDRS